MNLAKAYRSEFLIEADFCFLRVVSKVKLALIHEPTEGLRTCHIGLDRANRNCGVLEMERAKTNSPGL